MRAHGDIGFSILELVITVALMAVLTTVAVSNIKELENPLADASYQVSRFIRLVRARAISQTIVIVIQPSSTSEIVSFSSNDCAGTLTAIDDLSLSLPDGSSLTSTDWSACLNQRGLSDTNLVFQIQDIEGKTRTIELALGGGVQIQ
ncbi:MAG: hypothetical protein KDD64_01745 [Bdellovibrionales bacterium]|nr:hypothetical protein [Bdellovibrionales bacterium]